MMMIIVMIGKSFYEHGFLAVYLLCHIMVVESDLCAMAGAERAQLFAAGGAAEDESPDVDQASKLYTLPISVRDCPFGMCRFGARN